MKTAQKIIQGDCLEVMRGFADKSFDLVLTDPPYGIGESNEKNASRGNLAATTDFGHYEWDKVKIGREYFNEIHRVSKNQIIFGGNYYGSILGDTSCYIVWDKNNGDNDFADCELAWTSFKSAVRKFKYTWNGMIQENMKDKEARFHPTQKPLELMKWCLNKYATTGQKILDPFMGSGTTLLAAHQLELEATGIDLSPAYCKIAQDRLDATPNSLF